MIVRDEHVHETQRRRVVDALAFEEDLAGGQLLAGAGRAQLVLQAQVAEAANQIEPHTAVLKPVHEPVDFAAPEPAVGEDVDAAGHGVGGRDDVGVRLAGLGIDEWAGDQRRTVVAVGVDGAMNGVRFQAEADRFHAKALLLVQPMSQGDPAAALHVVIHGIGAEEDRAGWVGR